MTPERTFLLIRTPGALNKSAPTRALVDAFRVNVGVVPPLSWFVENSNGDPELRFAKDPDWPNFLDNLKVASQTSPQWVFHCVPTDAVESWFRERTELFFSLGVGVGLVVKRVNSNRREHGPYAGRLFQIEVDDTRAEPLKVKWPRVGEDRPRGKTFPAYWKTISLTADSVPRKDDLRNALAEWKSHCTEDFILMPSWGVQDQADIEEFERKARLRRALLAEFNSGAPVKFQPLAFVLRRMADHDLLATWLDRGATLSFSEPPAGGVYQAKIRIALPPDKFGSHEALVEFLNVEESIDPNDWKSVAQALRGDFERLCGKGMLILDTQPNRGAGTTASRFAPTGPMPTAPASAPNEFTEFLDDFRASKTFDSFSDDAKSVWDESFAGTQGATAKLVAFINDYFPPTAPAFCPAEPASFSAFARTIWYRIIEPVPAVRALFRGGLEEAPQEAFASREKDREGREYWAIRNADEAGDHAWIVAALSPAGTRIQMPGIGSFTLDASPLDGPDVLA